MGTACDGQWVIEVAKDKKKSKDTSKSCSKIIEGSQLLFKWCPFSGGMMLYDSECAVRTHEVSPSTIKRKCGLTRAQVTELQQLIPRFLWKGREEKNTHGMPNHNDSYSHEKGIKVWVSQFHTQITEVRPKHNYLGIAQIILSYILGISLSCIQGLLGRFFQGTFFVNYRFFMKAWLC